MAYTKAQKQAYFKSLRKRWNDNKALADNNEVMKAIHQEHCSKFSYYSFFFTAMMMKKLGFKGIPYIDCKTFNGWKEAGFIVKKGEKSKINGITWIHPKDSEGDEDERFSYPKMYNLFHRTQVQPL